MALYSLYCAYVPLGNCSLTCDGLKLKLSDSLITNVQYYSSTELLFNVQKDVLPITQAVRQYGRAMYYRYTVN